MEFPFHLINEIEHLEAGFNGIMVALTLRNYEMAGRTLGSLIGHALKLKGVEKPLPSN